MTLDPDCPSALDATGSDQALTAMALVSSVPRHNEQEASIRSTAVACWIVFIIISLAGINALNPAGDGVAELTDSDFYFLV